MRSNAEPEADMHRTVDIDEKTDRRDEEQAGETARPAGNRPPARRAQRPDRSPTTYHSATP